MYILYRCDCGRVLCSEEDNKTKQCEVCGKTIQLKNRRIIARVESNEEATLMVQKLQEEYYTNTDFQTADKL